jgi:hypothetical protein
MTKDPKIIQAVSETSHSLWPLLTWGTQFALTLGILAWLGHWLDQKLETKVLFVLIGIFMGLFGGFYRLYQIINKLQKPKSGKPS